MKIPKLYVLLFAGSALLSSQVMAASACTSEALVADRNFVLVNVRNATPGTSCSALTAQVRPYAGNEITNQTWDTSFIVASPPAGAAIRTINAVYDSCSKRDNGSADNDDIKSGTQEYSGHIMVLVNNNEALPARIVPAAYVRGELPKKGSKWSKLYPIDGAAPGLGSTKVCQMNDAATGQELYFCSYCTSKVKGND